MKKEELINFLKDEVLLKEKIEQTNGYILEQLKEANIEISKELLLNNMSIYSLKFIQENFNLSETDNEKIEDFILNNNQLINVKEVSNFFVGKKMTKKQIEYFLNKKINLPEHIILDFNTLKKYNKQICDQKETNIIAIRKIFNNSILNLSPNEVKNLDESLLLEFIDVLSINTNLIKNENFRDFFYKLVTNNIESPNIKLFKNYSFKQEDKEFLIKLLSNSNNNSLLRLSYNEVKKIKGVEELLNKYEYVKLFKITDIEKTFTFEDISNNKKFFQELWLEAKANKKFDIFDFILRNEATLEQFKEIVDKEFIKKIFAEEDSIYSLNSRIDREYNRLIVDKQLYLLDQILDLYINNDKLSELKKIKDVVSLENIFEFIQEVKNERFGAVNKEYFDELTKLVDVKIKKIYEIEIPNIFDKKNISLVLDNENLFFSPKTINLAENYLINNPSINSLYILVKLAEKYDKHYLDYKDKNIFLESFARIFSKHIESLSFKENELTIINILEACNNNFVNNLFKEEWSEYYDEKKTSKVKSNNFNIFDYSQEDLKNLDNKKLYAIYSISKNIFKDLLEENIKISDSLFLTILGNVKNEDFFNYLNIYINKNKDYILNNENLFSAIMLNDRQKDLLKIEDLSIFDREYNNCIELIDQIAVYYNHREFLSEKFPRAEWKYSLENLGVNNNQKNKKFINVNIEENITQKEAIFLYAEIYEAEKKLTKELEKIKNSIPFEFFSEKINTCLISRNYKEVLKLKKSLFKYDKTVFIKYVNNLTFDVLKESLDDKNFVELLNSELDYKNKTEIQFKDFTIDENLILLKKFKNIYKQKNKKIDDSTKKYGFLYFFNKQKNHFIKNFVIENYSKDLFYSHDFIAKDKSEFSLIKEHYSNEEIWKAYNKLKNKQGFFSEINDNHDYKNFFINAFFYDNKNNNQKLKSFLDFIKEKDSVLYLLLSNQSIFINTLDWGNEKYKTRGEGIAYYFKENYDLDIILKGLVEVVEMINKRDVKEKFNFELANSVITSTINNTYYENYGKNGILEKYVSIFSHNETIEIMKFLFEKAPLHLIDREIVAGAINTIDFFNKNIEHFYSKKNVENFIFPDGKVEPRYLDLYKEESESRERLIDYVCGLIDYATLIKDKDTVNIINCLIKENIYANENLSYEAKEKLYKGKSTIILDEISKDNRVLLKLKNSILKIELEDKLEKKHITKKNNKI